MIKLNLGSKWRKLDGFDNLDKIFGWHFQDGLPQYEDNSVDGITISHAFMFLTLDELKKFIKEIHRVLKPNGLIRITEDDTENPESIWYKTGNISSGPKNLTGPKIYRELFEKEGFKVFDVDKKTTNFVDSSLMQAYRGGPPNVFFLEAIKNVGKFIIRNDDVNFDTKLSEIKTFCEICDKYGFKIIQAITPLGEVKKVKTHRLNNDQIKALSNKKFSDNKEVVEYLRSRSDLIAVHGLYHTHKPTVDEIRTAKEILKNLGFNPTYFVPPFNEGAYTDIIEDLKLSVLSAEKDERLEDFLDSGTPNSPIMYLHSWRFDKKWYTFEKLEQCLNRLQQ